MARIRTIKPEFWSSPGIAKLDPWARLLYIAMWNWADDDGVGTANLRELLGFVFPNDDEIDVGALRRMCADLSEHVGVEFYEVSGRPYYSIPTWSLHQKIDKRRDGRYPKPSDAEAWLYGSSDQREQEIRRKVGARSAQSRRTVGAGTGETGTGEVGDGNRESSSSVSTSPRADDLASSIAALAGLASDDERIQKIPSMLDKHKPTAALPWARKVVENDGQQGLRALIDATPTVKPRGRRWRCADPSHIGLIDPGDRCPRCAEEIRTGDRPEHMHGQRLRKEAS